MESKTYFEVGVRYDKTLENGRIKTVTELYEVDALSFTEAEKRVTEYMKPFISGGFAVVKEKITNLSEVVLSQAPGSDLWYKVKANIVTIDEVTAKEKVEPVYLLFQARDINDARDRYVDHVSTWQVEPVLNTIAEISYIDFVG